ncbi:dihydroorotase [Patulibacter sp. SYSU D01012]|uniref:dihydroorotase n=1 Tax=Patulibacter sp. SYSU D01012 TaxID=2817381 RepID=UPI001B3075A1|nr:dihydroorotase [Patulibacter sp. SYSU D01012]
MSLDPLVRAPSADADVLLRRVHVLDPRAGIDAPHDVLVRDGLIAAIGEPGGLQPTGEQTEEIDGTGLHLFPGFVDPHVHLRTPGQEHKEDLETGTRSAAAGGYCAVVAMPNTSPVVDSSSLLGSLRDLASRLARVPVGFTAAITRGLEGTHLTEMAELRQAGAVGFTDDGRPVTDAGVLRKALQYQRLCGGVIALHEEDPSLSAGGAMREGSVSARLGIAGVPWLSEATMVARDAEIAGYEDGRMHFQHLSCVASVDALRAGKARGFRVSGEASPHHLLLTHDDVRDLDTSMKMNPPLGFEEDRQALIDAVRDGTIETIATDHAPHARHEKELPFEQAPMGTTGLESAFAAVYSGLVRPGVLSLATVVDRLIGGAALMELPTPTVAVGARANLCLVDLEREWTVGEDGYESKSSNCCFHGRRVHGRVLLTLADGSVAYRERHFAVHAA